MKAWGTSLLRAITVTAKDSDIPSRHQEQLCIGVSMLTRLFGDLVIGEIAITGRDPFLKEGTDITVISEAWQAMKDKHVVGPPPTWILLKNLRENGGTRV